ncbi:wall-associated receptor kinase-like 18 [Magnolia sinica]|uniref:wall-associated receptor kinase-like 18 n=1 Tax=Magnolia sinica TaxID=86752 RepID=UPI002659F393|nr:wall-associated receptor kinase-like 18 [Magnolia sinica]
MKLSVKKMRTKQERNFIDNGGRMLEEFISSCGGRVNPIRMYSAAELEKAIGNTNPLWKYTYGDGNYYKGTYLGRTILIKKFNLNSDRTSWQRDLIFNEMTVLSQMRHKNVVKLLGCCLETELPMLVFEFVSNGSLVQYIDDADLSGPRRRISWEDRLRIATEVADALTYMHTATAKPIVLMDLQPSNILLNENYSAKVIEFGLAMSIPLGEEILTVDRIQGTNGYCSPEYAIGGQVSEKCDVYCFGHLLLELLTGKRSRFLTSTTVANVDLAISFIEDKLLRLELDAGNWSKGKTDQLLAFAVLASRCLKRDGEERPTMKEVVQELRRIIRSSLETRNTTETENVSMVEVHQELRRISRYLYEAMFMTETERHSDVSDLSDVRDFSLR